MTGDDPPVVLAVDDDEKLLETYEMWLGSTYELRTATGGEEALDQLDEDVQVVLLDRLMPGLSGDRVLDEIREMELNCRVAMVTAVEPDFDIADMPFDAYVPKALDRETVRETVERLLARAEYDDVLQEHYTVAERLATIEDQKPESELARSEAYQNLVARFEELEERLETRAESLDRNDFVSSIDGLSRFESGGDAQEGNST
jgi:two-component system response regulator AdeR